MQSSTTGNITTAASTASAHHLGGGMWWDLQTSCCRWVWGEMVDNRSGRGETQPRHTRSAARVPLA